MRWRPIIWRSSRSGTRSRAPPSSRSPISGSSRPSDSASDERPSTNDGETAAMAAGGPDEQPGGELPAGCEAGECLWGTGSEHGGVGYSTASGLPARLHGGDSLWDRERAVYV